MNPVLVGLGIDAQRCNLNFNENIINSNFPFETLVDEFHKEDYKSAFFLLMDYVGTENFISLSNSDLPDMKAKFIEICRNFKDEAILIELLGTLKKYKTLKILNTCFHIYKSKRNTFTQIGEIWKVLYTLCEELTDEDLKLLIQKVPENSRNYIHSPEDWFCWALNENIFSRSSLSNLEDIFKEYPNCLKVLTEFEVYPMKVPSSSSHCGIALILNYEKFDKNANLEQRHNSDKDVEALKKVWRNFGFKTEDRTNLNRSETFKIIEDYAAEDHTSYDAFVCCILSHGKSNAVYSSDGDLIEISDLIKPIVNSCQSLENKPKLFFIQACQGTYVHQGPGKQIYRCQTEETTSTQPTPPSLTVDTVISYSTIDGFASIRDEKGGWFIQTFCEVMMQVGDTCTIQDILTKVNNEMINKYSANFGPSGPSKARQAAQNNYCLRKKLLFKKCLN